MKRIILVFGIILFFPVMMFSQIAEDAIRFSQNYYGGTARSASMGGAFGALGGDFSSLSINPAGLGVYRGSELTLTPTLNYDKSTATYLNSSYDDFRYKFNFNNLGLVLNVNSNRDVGWVGANFALGFNRLNDFHRNYTITARNANSSLMDEFVYNSNNGFASEYYEDLAWDSYLLDYDEDLGIYFSDFDIDGYGQSQDRLVDTQGGINEFTFSFGTNYSHKLYLGATVGVQRLRYEEYKEHSEFDDHEAFQHFREFTFKETFKTWGTGYNFKLGAIYRPIEMIRLGAALHTPTFYNLSSDFHTSMAAYYHSDSPLENGSARSDVATFNYSLITPLRMIGSVGVHILKIGLISFDYEYADYTKARMRSDTDNFRDVNSDIQEIYDATHNFRVGGEIRLENLSFRAGYAYYGSPFASGAGNRDASLSNISAGFGVRSANVFFDFAYVYSMFEHDHVMYDYGTGSAVAGIDSNTSRILATIGFRF